MIELNNIKIGADPELFLEKDGEIISAEGIIGGTKYEPQPISDQGHYIQEDNIMIEFNIPPSKDKDEFKNNINFVKDYLSALVKLQGCSLNYSSSANLNNKYLKTKQAKEFGCEPDYCVYTKSEISKPNSIGNLRTCGGHIHVGFDNPTTPVRIELVKAMDITLGLESVLLDEDIERRKQYGKAGSFRFKDYGLEYRTLSNFWIRNNELIEWAYNQTIKAIELVKTGEIKKYDKYSSQIIQAINTNDIELVQELIEKINKTELILK